MISDDNFRISLDKAMKKQNLIKKERNRLIDNYLQFPIAQRDAIIDAEEKRANSRQIKEVVPSESSEQQDFVFWFRKTYSDIKIIAIPNGGFRNNREALKLKLEGVEEGVSDLYVPAWNCWIEFKRIKGSVWSQEQKEWKEYVESIGHTYLLAYGCEHAKKLVQVFLINKFNFG